MNLPCRVCGKTKPEGDFHVNRANRNGRLTACKECCKAIRRQRYLTHGAEDAERTRRWKERNPEKEAARSRRAGIRKHGIAPEQFDELLTRQGGVCASCGGADSRRLNIDHDHNCCPGRYSCGSCVRGLLCRKCNSALGLLGDDVTLIQRLAAYRSRLQDFGMVS